MEQKGELSRINATLYLCCSHSSGRIAAAGLAINRQSAAAKLSLASYFSQLLGHRIPWPRRPALEDPSLAFRWRGVSGPDCRHLPLKYRFEMLQCARRGFAGESGEVVHHVHLVIVAEAMGDLGP